MGIQLIPAPINNIIVRAVDDLLVSSPSSPARRMPILMSQTSPIVLNRL